VLGVHAPAWMIGDDEQRIFLGALGADGLLVADALAIHLAPAGAQVVGEVLVSRWPRTRASRRRGERVLLRVFVEVVETGVDIFQPSAVGTT